MKHPDRCWLYSGLLIGVALLLTSCGAGSVSIAAQVPPTPTDTYPPDWKTPTPIPPEHQQFFIAVGNAGNGVPAIQPRTVTNASTSLPITAADVRQYVATHPMEGSKVSLVGDPSPVIKDVELLTLGEVHQRYFADALRQYGWQAPQPATTQVYMVTLSGRFRLAGGPPPGLHGTYQIGVWVFDAHTGDDLLEGGVGRIDPPQEATPDEQ